MKKSTIVRGEAITISGRTFMGVREAKKVVALFEGIGEYEKNTVSLLIKTACAYYEAGNIIADAIRRWKIKDGRLSLKAVAEAGGYPENRITLSLKIYKGFEHNPAALESLTLRDALKLIAPPPETGEDGYNRIDLGGDPGQMELDFGELFELPSTANSTLQNYRTVADLLTEIIVVRRGKNNLLTSKRFLHFCEDVPQNPALRHAYKTMVYQTQAAIEDYLAAVEQEED